MEFIETGLRSLVKNVIERDIKSLAVPALGCGLGGLDWSQVRPAIEYAFLELPEIEVYLFEPS